MYGFSAASPAGPNDGPVAAVTLAGLLMLATLGVLAVVLTPRGPVGGLPGPGTADDVAAGSNAPTTASATTPRNALLRRDLVMSGDLSDDLTAETPGTHAF